MDTIIQLLLLGVTIVIASNKTTYVILSKFSKLESKLDSKFRKLDSSILASDYKVEDALERLNELEEEVKEVREWIIKEQTKEIVKRRNYDTSNHN